MDRANKRTRKWYPGTEGGPFHAVLLTLDAIDRLPSLLLGLALALGASAVGGFLYAIGIPATTATVAALTLLAAIIGDWLLLAALPRARRSFGPVQPPLVMLAVLRMLANLVLGLAPLVGLPEPWSWLLLVATQVSGTLLAVRGMWFEPQSLTVTHQSLSSPKLPADRPALRILHLADIHMERLTERDREVVRQAQALQPDVILFTGDFLNISYTYDPIAWEQVREMLRQFSAPLGFYAVTGSPPVDPPEVVEKLLDGLNIRWLKDERLTLEYGDGQSLNLIGVTCCHVPDLDAPRLAQLIDGSTRFNLLLYHSPDLAPDAAELGIDLQLAGHTHGGQVRLPFYGALYAASIYGKEFEVGLRQVGNMQLFVSRGIGLEGKGAPRVRFLCPPEITLIELHGPSPS